MYGFSFDYIFSILFFVAFLFVFSIFVLTGLKSITEWNKNNNSPKLTVDARVIKKRNQVSNSDYLDHNGMIHTTSSISYYVTFQVEREDQIEMRLSRKEYIMLVEGDYGKLTFQGTRYISFEK
ncbi:DUF2500 domain-containing protein [Intestinibacter sp.]|uniref:DUF2500 domain-containing protein n=1 Tax=Intestinibacter sp. TaxID=1965304 RepID=UPI002A760CB4|nr:DUF2500 domain-containing protein [Intestinibacter sp.]MDY2735164.1 DUF2500 domain-containing protein [Intestinibacter sp.]MDY4575712.1 DUF2500 domain-containing protein [Intestinibacter sp.]